LLGYINCFNAVKLALIRKETYTFVRINRKNLLCLQLLLKYNVINGFKKINFKEKEVFFVYLNTKYLWFNLKNLYKITNAQSLKYYLMNQLQNKNTKTIYIFSTSKGLLNLQECINLKIGGVVLFRIN